MENTLSYAEESMIEYLEKWTESEIKNLRFKVSPNCFKISDDKVIVFGFDIMKEGDSWHVINTDSYFDNMHHAILFCELLHGKMYKHASDFLDAANRLHLIVKNKETIAAKIKKEKKLEKIYILQDVDSEISDRYVRVKENFNNLLNTISRLPQRG